MRETNRAEDEDWVVVDDTTIYEVDAACCRCMSQEERRSAELEYSAKEKT
jgi:hypothetical protein